MSKKQTNISKMIKKAVIRSNESEPCPFGLPIPYGCHNAGNIVTFMAPLTILGPDTDEEELSEIAKANYHLFMWKNPCKRCKFAGKLFETHNDVVECSFDESYSGAPEIGTALTGSPFYYKHFSGVGMDGLYSYPLGYYSDNSIDRAIYMGMYSLEGSGSDREERMVKNTSKYLQPLRWSKYLSGKAGEYGVYIQRLKKGGKEINYYGPFRNKEYAEFFNYLAFCSPHCVDAKEQSKINIDFLNKKKIGEINKNASSNYGIEFNHPSSMLFEISPVGIWWQDTYGKVLNPKMVLKLANETGAKGYDAFRDWLISGSKIGGVGVHALVD